MKKNTILLIVSCCIFFAGAVTSAFAFDDGDLQTWDDIVLKKKINDKTSISLEGEVKWGDDIRDFFYYHLDSGVQYKFTKWFTGGINYRWIFSESAGAFNDEHRPHINATFKTKWKGFSVSDRHRFEYRMLDKKDDRFRYRNKLKIVLPFSWTSKEIRPYIADEVFVDFDIGETNQNRLFGGFLMKVAEDISLDMFYFWQSNKGSSTSEWTDAHVVGSRWSFGF